MKSTGIVRRIDDLGRVVVPKELRNTMGIAEGDPVEIFVDGNKIILRKYQPGCRSCGEFKNLLEVDGVLICETCARNIAAKYQDIGGLI